MSPPPQPEARIGDRGEVLALLSVALRPPRDPAALEASLQGLRDLLVEGEMRVWIDEALRLTRDSRVDREYHRLFLGPMRPVAPPFESVYRDGVAFGPSTADFLEELRREGLETVDTFRLPPDHVAVELEYLAHMLLRAREARAGAYPEESVARLDHAQAFVDRHLAQWLPRFLGRLEAAAPESPYTALVRLALKVLGIRMAPRSPQGDA